MKPDQARISLLASMTILEHIYGKNQPPSLPSNVNDYPRSLREIFGVTIDTGGEHKRQFSNPNQAIQNPGGNFGGQGGINGVTSTSAGVSFGVPISTSTPLAVNFPGFGLPPVPSLPGSQPSVTAPSSSSVSGILIGQAPTNLTRPSLLGPTAPWSAEYQCS